jgi:hypothetical protein
MTNFEKIKSLGKKELAAYFFNMGFRCDVCVARDKGLGCFPNSCVGGIEDWLKEEAE